MGVKGFLLRCKIRIVATPTKDRELPNAALSSDASSLIIFAASLVLFPADKPLLFPADKLIFARVTPSPIGPRDFGGDQDS